MLKLVALSAAIIAVVKAENEILQPPNRFADVNAVQPPEIGVVEDSKSYVVQLDCVGCPFAVKDVENTITWQQSTQPNALQLNFTVDTSRSQDQSLLLNGHRILPLDPMPLKINALQVTTLKDKQSGWLTPTIKGLEVPLQYEHSVLRTQEAGQLWVQFDVTGLPLSEVESAAYASLDVGPVKLDNEEQKLVQILLRNETNGLAIEDIQVVARKDRAQPYRMKCGRLALVQTAFDPTEWDKYGKLGSDSRILNMVTSIMAEFWSNNVQHNPLMLPLALVLAFGIFMLRRWYQRRQEEKSFREDDAELALLHSGYEYEDMPPAYGDISRNIIPVIKIEEYD